MEDLRRQEVRELARLTAQLDAAQQIFFQAEYGRHRRNPTTALLLCLLLGDFGAHYFYFGRYRAGLLRLAFCWTLVPWVIALFEAHTITTRAIRYNASLANELLLAVKGAVDGGGGGRAGACHRAERGPERDGDCCPHGCRDGGRPGRGWRRQRPRGVSRCTQRGADRPRGNGPRCHDRPRAGRHRGYR
jgi:TM2 domain-containing membrane protein YozV